MLARLSIRDIVLIDRLDPRAEELKKRHPIASLFESDAHGNLRVTGEPVLV